MSQDLRPLKRVAKRRIAEEEETETENHHENDTNTSTSTSISTSSAMSEPGPRVKRTGAKKTIHEEEDEVSIFTPVQPQVANNNRGNAPPRPEKIRRMLEEIEGKSIKLTSEPNEVFVASISRHCCLRFKREGGYLAAKNGPERYPVFSFETKGGESDEELRAKLERICSMARVIKPCPDCGVFPSYLMSQSEKNPDKPYLACPSGDDGERKHCRFRWVEEEMGPTCTRCIGKVLSVGDCSKCLQAKFDF